MIARSLLNKMNNLQDNDNIAIGSRDEGRVELEIKALQQNGFYDQDKNFGLTYYDNGRKLALTVGKTTGEYTVSIFPWKDKDIKKLIARIKYAISHASETKASQSIYKLFPDAVTYEFEKTVLK